ncbi:MAG: type II secretion system protein [Alphaproteobacteria bacterium]|nr:type II secretion system protein [Alphaproteobacteria bacterium]
MKKTNQKGATMIEVLGVLSILSVMSVGVYSSIAAVQAKVKITQAQDQVSRIIKSMRSQFSAFHPSSVSAGALNKIGIFDNVTDDGKAYHVYGDEMEIQLSKVGDSDGYTSSFSESDPTFKLIYHNIPTRACIDLLMADWGSDPSSGLVEISTGTASSVTFQWRKDYTEEATHHPLPPQVTEAAEECSRAATVNVSWEYYF